MYLLKRGASVKFARFTSQQLLRIVEILKVCQLRAVTRNEIAAAFRRHFKRAEAKRTIHRANLGKELERLAVRWFAFHGVLRSRRPQRPFREEVEGFIAYWRDKQLGPVTLKNLLIHITYFLRWYSKSKRPLSKISLKDIDNFILFMKANGWSPLSLNAIVRDLRRFFQYGAERGWCKRTLSGAIITPARTYAHVPRQGREWREVQGLLKSITQSDLAGVRAKAILSLVVMYALRSREIERLAISDFDWCQRILTIRRSKRGPAQRYPLQREVAQNVRRYIKVRPLCSCDRLFVTLTPPYRAVSARGLSVLVRHRLKKMGITTGRLGPHSIRHARATQLLQRGMSLKQVGDFLGHRHLDATFKYARFSLKLLRPVAEFNLGDLV